MKWTADAVLRRFEARFVAAAPQPQFTPIFITGLPRVGSTLVYQAVVRRFATAFFCNAAAGVPHAPALVTTILSRALTITPPDRFTNRYGSTPGWNGPAQGREIWGRWFPLDQTYVPAGGSDPAAIREMRGTVARLEQCFRAPFVNKSQGHAVRILPLGEAFPRALFVRVHRDRSAVAASVLLGRRECHGDDRAWFSAKPRDYECLRELDPVDQIVGQIRGLERHLEDDLSRLGDDRVVDLDYEVFCAAPREALDGLAAHYERITGHRLGIRGDGPERFVPSVRGAAAASECPAIRERLGEPSSPDRMATHSSSSSSRPEPGRDDP